MESKLRNCFDEMVVYKDLKKSNFFSSLGLPSFLRDWVSWKLFYFRMSIHFCVLQVRRKLLWLRI